MLKEHTLTLSCIVTPSFLKHWKFNLWSRR